MTPLEAGVLGGGLLFFVAAVGWTPPVGTLWLGATLAALAGAALAGGAANATLAGWSTAGAAHPADPVGYLAGPVGGPAWGDLKFVCLLLFALAGVAYLAGRPPAETLVVGTTAVAAGLLTFATDNLVSLYLTLELQALSLYTLAGLYKFDEERTDGAVRYLLSGSLVSGFMLLGFARGYGANGTFQLFEFTRDDPVGSAWLVGMILFKAGVFPFHFWSPVVYAPLEWGTLALVVGATKVNLWYLLGRTVAAAAAPVWWALWWVGLASVVAGSVGGYFQTNVGSLLGYSGAVNGGYLVLLLLGTPRDGGFALGYYTGVYLGGTLALVVGLSVFGDTQTTWFTTWSKLGVTYPLAVYYAALNLGGLPVFPGFAGKLVLLWGIAPFGLATLAFVVGSSVAPAVYYVATAGAALFGYTDREVNPPHPVHPVAAATAAVTAGAAVGTVGALAGV